jgi:hypothetical protein
MSGIPNLQELSDRAALHDLVMSYCRGVDRRDFELVRSLYHEDAREDRGGIFQGSRDEFVSWLPQVTATFEATIHRVFNTLFVIDGDRAQGEIYAEAYHRTRPPDAQEIIIGGRFLDHYERRGDKWRIMFRTSTADCAQVRPVASSATEGLGSALTAGSAGAYDLSYLKLSLLGRHGA